MKRFFTLALTGMTLACVAQDNHRPEFKEHIHKEFTLSKPANASTLAIYNFDGFVKVEGYSGDKVVIEIDKIISGKNERIMQQGKDEFQLSFDQDADTITAYISEPFDSRPHRNRWDWDDRKKIEYRFQLEFTVKIPYAMNLVAHTVTNGNVTVKDVAGDLHVNNVNGSVSIVNAKNTTVAHTVNGNVDINYLAAPQGPSSYYTVNGKINVTYPASLSADLQLKSMNGEFFTNFDNAQMLPVTASKTQEDNDGVLTYKLNKNTIVRIGKGGSLFKFETLNGNIYIRKQS